MKQKEDNLTLNVASTSPTLLFPPGSQPYDQCWQRLTSNTHTSINNWTSNLPFHSMLKLKQRDLIGNNNNNNNNNHYYNNNKPITMLETAFLKSFISAITEMIFNFWRIESHIQSLEKAM